MKAREDWEQGLRELRSNAEAYLGDHREALRRMRLYDYEPGKHLDCTVLIDGERVSVCYSCGFKDGVMVYHASVAPMPASGAPVSDGICAKLKSVLFDRHQTPMEVPGLPFSRVRHFSVQHRAAETG